VGHPGGVGSVWRFDKDAAEQGERERDPSDEGESLALGPEGADDPDTMWLSPDSAAPPLPPLSSDTFVIVEPGEEAMIMDSLPPPRRLRLALAFRFGELVVCQGRRRSRCATPTGATPDSSSLPVAQCLTLVFIRHRSRGNTRKPNKYAIVTGTDSGLLGWLDYSDSWNFDASVLKELAQRSGMSYEVERFTTAHEFDGAHPDWIG